MALADGSANLPQTRQTGRDQATALVTVAEQVKLERGTGAWPNQAHFAAHNINKLRQFIDAQSAEKNPPRMSRLSLPSSFLVG